MSNYHVYQEALASAGYGTPLWEPSSTTCTKPLCIGDVGYLQFGTFIRLFNVTLPSGHQDNEYGEPDNYVPLMVYPDQLRRTVLPKGIIASSGVQASKVPQVGTTGRICFKCTDKIGAVVMAAEEVVREDALPLDIFADYAIAHAHTWIQFARHRLMREVALHELILLTGCDLTTGRYSLTVFQGARHSKRLGQGASFQLRDPESRAQFLPDHPSISYFQHNSGPSMSTHSSTHCLFIRGFKILDRHVETMEREEKHRSLFAAISGTAQHYTPLDAVLRYLSEKSNADIAIAHDVDLNKLFQKDNATWDYKYIMRRLRKDQQSINLQGSGTLSLEFAMLSSDCFSVTVASFM
ncbi:hypothetical protein K439DRAFT_1610213 [Ramaria rubella]|nr:hypothetical protein K439DRAFT_1610213 [Ramaria rubella]